MDRPLRIALCTDGVFPLAMGGMQRHSRLLAEHLANDPGIRLTVIHPHAERVFHPDLGIEEVRIAPIDERAFYVAELWRYSGRVAEELQRIDPDAILSQGFSVWQGMRRFSDRLVVMPHGLEMFQGLTTRDRLTGLPFRWMVRHVARRAAFVVSLGGKLTPMLQRLSAGSQTKVVTVPNAVEIKEALPYPSDKDGIRFLFVGRFAFNKGIDLLVRIARELEAELPQARFLLAGDGPERAAMERAGLPSNVALLGKVSDADLERLYAECHALLLPTRFEGMPTVALEAMARARPVIVSDVGASGELVDETNGALLPPGDPVALRAAVLAFARLPSSERERMGRIGHQRVSERFTWPLVTAEFVRLARAVSRSQRV